MASDEVCSDQAKSTPFAWWHSNDQERWQGPCETREEAVEEAVEWGHRFICEANQPIVRARDLFDVTRITEDFDNCQGYDLSDPDGDGLFARVKDAQWADLTARIHAAADEWQKVHGIVISAWSFEDTRNEETIALPDDELAVPNGTR
jgi:hypothetical protein